MSCFLPEDLPLLFIFSPRLFTVANFNLFFYLLSFCLYTRVYLSSNTKYIYERTFSKEDAARFRWPLNASAPLLLYSRVVVKVSSLLIFIRSIKEYCAWRHRFLLLRSLALMTYIVKRKQKKKKKTLS